MKTICVVLAVLLTVNGAFAFWSNCPSGAPPSAVSSPDCTDRCRVTRGGTLTGTAVFAATGNHAALQSTFHGVVLGLEVDLTGNDPAANQVCQQLQGATCPLTAGASYTWNISFAVPTTVPALTNTPVRIRIRDGAAIVSCAQVTADIS